MRFKNRVAEPTLHLFPIGTVGANSSIGKGARLAEGHPLDGSPAASGEQQQSAQQVEALT